MVWGVVRFKSHKLRMKNSHMSTDFQFIQVAHTFFRVNAIRLHAIVLDESKKASNDIQWISMCDRVIERTSARARVIRTYRMCVHTFCTFIILYYILFQSFHFVSCELNNECGNGQSVKLI